MGFELLMNIADVCECLKGLSRGVPAWIERQRVLFKHALKLADHAARALHDEPALAGISADWLEPEFFIKRL